MDEEGVGTLGITQVAQRSLGEIVYCRLPREGERVGVMETIATLEALKTVGEVHSPVAGEVVEVNPRLERSPALVTQSPLAEGWLARIAFRRIPDYLRQSRAVSRAELEPILADQGALRDFLAGRLLPPDAPRPSRDSQEDLADAAGAAQQSAARLLEELRFDTLRSDERHMLHNLAQELGYATESRGRGAGRHIVVLHPEAARAAQEAAAARRQQESGHLESKFEATEAEKSRDDAFPDIDDPDGDGGEDLDDRPPRARGRKSRRSAARF